MFRVATQRDFIAQHAMIGGDFGAESDRHSHHFVLELELMGSELNRDGFLMDIADLDDNLDQRVAYFEEQNLNEMDIFEGVNPTLENFARVLCEELANEIYADNVEKITVRLWQDESTWAAYEINR